MNLLLVACNCTYNKNATEFLHKYKQWLYPTYDVDQSLAYRQGNIFHIALWLGNI